MMTFTREPSAKRAGSHHGCPTSSTRLPSGRDDAVDNAQHLAVIAEAQVGLFQDAVALHDHLVGAVHQDFRHRVIPQERLDHAEAEDVGHHLLKQLVAVLPGKGSSSSWRISAKMRSRERRTSSTLPVSTVVGWLASERRRRCTRSLMLAYWAVRP